MFFAGMAKQMGAIKITGTIGETCFYKMNGEYYARRKSSLSRKRVKTSKAFKETMRYAGLMAKASVISSTIYQLLPKKKKSRKLYQQLTGKAMQLLKQDLSKTETVKRLKAFVKKL